MRHPLLTVMLLALGGCATTAPVVPTLAGKPRQSVNAERPAVAPLNAAEEASTEVFQ
jgi:hypothetical protein